MQLSYLVRLPIAQRQVHLKINAKVYKQINMLY